MDTQIKEMLIGHLPGRYTDTLNCYEVFTSESWKDMREDGSMRGFVSYFFLDFSYDMIITAATNNIFSKAQWRVLKNTIKGRTKPLRIQSDPSNPVLHRAVKSFGGKFVEDEIYFPAPGTSYA